MQRQTVLSDNDFPKYLPSPCGYVHCGSWTVSQTIPPQGSMVTRIQQQFPPLAFTHRDSLNLFHNLMNCGWWNSLQSCAEKHCLWTDWQFSHEVWHKVMNNNASLLTKTKPFILNFDWAPVTSSIANCGTLQNSATFQSCFASVPTFFDCVAGIYILLFIF